MSSRDMDHSEQINLFQTEMRPIVDKLESMVQMQDKTNLIAHPDPLKQF